MFFFVEFCELLGIKHLPYIKIRVRAARAAKHREGYDVGAEAFGKGAQGFPLLVGKTGQRVIVSVLCGSGGFFRLSLVHFVFRGRSGFGFLLRFGLGFASRRGFKRIVGQINDRRDGRLDGWFLLRFGLGFASRRGFKRVVNRINDRRDCRLDGWFLLRFGLGFVSRRVFKRVVARINDGRDGRLDGRFLCRFGGGFLVQFNRGFCVQFLRSFFRKFVDHCRHMVFFREYAHGQCAQQHRQHQKCGQEFPKLLLHGLPPLFVVRMDFTYGKGC